MIKPRYVLVIAAQILAATALAASENAVSSANTTMTVSELAARLAQTIRGKGHRSAAVLAFRNAGASDFAEGTKIAGDLAAALSREERLQTLDLTASGSGDPNMAGRVGRDAGAEVVVSGSFATLPSSIALELRLIDSATGDVFEQGKFFLARDVPVVPSTAPVASGPSFETESYTIRVVGARRAVRSNRTTVLVDLVVESLVRDTSGILRKGPEFRGVPPGRADSWYLVDDAGRRFDQRGSDSAGICSPSHDAGVDLLPSGRVGSRFTFVAPGRVESATVTLVGIEMAPHPGRTISVEEIGISDTIR